MNLKPTTIAAIGFVIVVAVIAINGLLYLVPPKASTTPSSYNSQIASPTSSIPSPVTTTPSLGNRTLSANSSATHVASGSGSLPWLFRGAFAFYSGNGTWSDLFCTPTYVNTGTGSVSPPLNCGAYALMVNMTIVDYNSTRYAVTINYNFTSRPYGTYGTAFALNGTMTNWFRIGEPPNPIPLLVHSGPTTFVSASGYTYY